MTAHPTLLLAATIYQRSKSAQHVIEVALESLPLPLQGFQIHGDDEHDLENDKHHAADAEHWGVRRLDRLVKLVVQHCCRDC